MNIKYYVCGRNGIISEHTKYKTALKEYNKILRRNKYPTIALRKREDDKIMERVYCNYGYPYPMWIPVDSLIVQY